MLKVRTTIAIIVIGFALACGETSKPASPSSGSKSSEAATSNSPTPADAARGEEVECPVCGLKFMSSETEYSLVRGGRRYYFLLEDHMRAFEADPKSYLHN